MIPVIIELAGLAVYGFAFAMLVSANRMLMKECKRMTAQLQAESQALETLITQNIVHSLKISIAVRALGVISAKGDPQSREIADSTLERLDPERKMLTEESTEEQA